MYTRLEFELAVKSKWSDSYIFNLEASGRYVDEILEAMFWAWQASRQAIDSGKPLGYVAPRMLADIKAGKYFGINTREASRDDAIALYTHPASTDVSDWKTEAKRAFWSGLEIGASIGAVSIAPRWDKYVAKRKEEMGQGVTGGGA